MSGELTVANLADNVRDKVRSTIVNLIPDEQIDGLVKKEWDGFFNPPAKRDQWDNKENLSQFQIMVRRETEVFMLERVREGVKKEMERFSQVMWNEKGKESLKQIVAEYTPYAMQNIVGQVVQNTMNNMQRNGQF